jgi:RNA polymerase sigma factor (sigma-70 family)
VEEHARRTPDPASLEIYRPALTRYFGRRVRDAAEVDDLVQEAMIRLIERPGGDSVANPQAYLFRIAHNLVADHYRRRRGGDHDLIDECEMPGIAAAQEQGRNFSDLQFLLESALAELPENCRTAFVLRRFEGYETEEIAARLGVSRRMVQKYLVRAMTHLYVTLRPVMESDG